MRSFFFLVKKTRIFSDDSYRERRTFWMRSNQMFSFQKIGANGDAYIGTFDEKTTAIMKQQ